MAEVIKPGELGGLFTDLAFSFLATRTSADGIGPGHRERIRWVVRDHPGADVAEATRIWLKSYGGVSDENLEEATAKWLPLVRAFLDAEGRRR